MRKGSDKALRIPGLRSEAKSYDITDTSLFAASFSRCYL